MIGGVQWPVRATAKHQVSAIDQADVRGIQSPTRDATRAGAHVLAGQRPLNPSRACSASLTAGRSQRPPDAVSSNTFLHPASLRARIWGAVSWSPRLTGLTRAAATRPK